jgi:hypothetical protein
MTAAGAVPGMDFRAGMVLLALLVAGCTSKPEPRHPTAEELSVAYSPAARQEPDEPPSEDDRQSRPPSQYAPRAENITPARWEGATDEIICVDVGGCPGFIVNHDDSHFFSVDGRVWRVRVTVTWDPVEEATRELEVSMGGSNVTGPSPLVLEVPYRDERESRMRVSVSGVERGIVTHLPSQPFAAIAEFNV